MRGGPLWARGQMGVPVLKTGAGEESWLCSNKKQKSVVRESTSVMDERRGPIPLASTTTLSSSLAMAAASNNSSLQWPPCNSTTTTSSSIEENGEEEWASELQPILAGPALGVQHLDDVLPDRWITGGGEELQDVLGLQPSNPTFAFNPIAAIAGEATLNPNLGIGPSLASGVSSGVGLPPVFLGQAAAPSLLVNSLPLPQSLPSGLFYHEPMIGSNVHQHKQAAFPEQAIIDRLSKAAKLVEARDFTGAHGILARLNQCLPSPVGKPFLRSGFYLKEALHRLLANASLPQTPPATPFDVALKIDAYKTFSDISPVLQFTYFTCTQTLLEELSDTDRIHIIDFDIGIGGQWSSFMQELAHRHGSTAPLLRITAIASSCSHSWLELHLTRESLSHFAAELGIQLEFNVLTLDSLDTSAILALSNGVDEAIAVNLSIGYGYHLPIPALLCLVRQLSPKIVVTVDHRCYRSDLSFSEHLLHAFQFCTVFLDSIDALGTSLDVANKIERFLLQPRIEGAVLDHYHLAEKMLPWRTAFTSAGFVAAQFSNVTEIQAEFLLKRVQVRGFHVEKHQASLSLCWQRRELVSVLAWRC